MSRGFRYLVGRWMILIMVLTQVAVSAYACPSLAPAMTDLRVDVVGMAVGQSAMSVPAARSVVASAGAQNQMIDCDGMVAHLDPAAPTLCDACCHHDQQPDHASSLAAPAVILNSLYAVPAAVSEPAPARLDAQASSDLVAAAPPRTVLNCCWRI